MSAPTMGHKASALAEAKDKQNLDSFTRACFSSSQSRVIIVLFGLSLFLLIPTFRKIGDDLVWNQASQETGVVAQGTGDAEAKETGVVAQGRNQASQETTGVVAQGRNQASQETPGVVAQGRNQASQETTGVVAQGRNQASQDTTGVVTQGTGDAEAKCAEPQTFLIDNFGLRGPISWDVLPVEVQEEFLLNGSSSLNFWYLYNNLGWAPGTPIDHRVGANLKIVWSRDLVQSYIDKARSRAPDTSSYGQETTKDLFAAVDAHSVQGKSVLIIGSQIPWVEAIMHVSGASSITVVDFNPPRVEYPNFVETVGISQLDATERKFDIVVSYSSLEHDGLGRYGDPLNPNADLERMKRTRQFLNPGGLFFLGVPNGRDVLHFNAHRVYGPVRFPLLIQGFDLVNTYSSTPLEELYKLDLCRRRVGECPQPVHVLKVKEDI